MELEQMMARLLAEIRTKTEKMHANQAEMKANHAKTHANLREMRAGQELLKEEMLVKLDAHHERMMARMDSQLEKATDLESNPEEIESKAEHKEVPKEEATVETLEALKKRYRDRHLAVRHCYQPNGGSQKKMAAVRGWLTRHTIPERHKGPSCQAHGNTRLCQKPRKDGHS
jgi:tRNA/tmRNA/rRNA uracil-C5-methylase (TrmA/RlmC/RlmD family)